MVKLTPEDIFDTIKQQAIETAYHKYFKPGIGGSLAVKKAIVTWKRWLHPQAEAMLLKINPNKEDW